MTTNCGSWMPEKCATFVLLRTPSHANTSQTTMEGIRRIAVPQGPESKGASLPEPQITHTKSGGNGVGEPGLFARSGSDDGVSAWCHSARRDPVRTSWARN